MAFAKMQLRGRTLFLPAVLLILASSMATTTRAAAAGGCADDKLPANRTYAHCAALAQLGATLHWSYDAKIALLSLAFVARTPSANGTAGWVAWALNPTGAGMKGAQALVAFKRGNPPAYVVNTYNLTGHRALGGDSTPIAYRATDLAADESGGKVRLYGTLQLHQGMEVVNHIWNVGSTVTDGAPVKHALAEENMDARGRLVLSGSVLGLAPEPAPAPAPRGSSAKDSSGGAAPTYVSTPVLMLLAFAGFLAIA
ncbi:Auxin-induced in root cultures protein 12 [Dichanthelium oligosanthes]|uniref:Auxin-induced in root cultures protein 12 n=1 Tax=Dichanthelium oligosanthes TaxID=888268 RepID=A0A1E5V541_9POAL|nr:Auxin-induced in root cultures protein 12 [Dichanthelium oligosanthes]